MHTLIICPRSIKAPGRQAPNSSSNSTSSFMYLTFLPPASRHRVPRESPSIQRAFLSRFPTYINSRPRMQDMPLCRGPSFADRVEEEASQEGRSMRTGILRPRSETGRPVPLTLGLSHSFDAVVAAVAADQKQHPPLASCSMQSSTHYTS